MLTKVVKGSIYTTKQLTKQLFLCYVVVSARSKVVELDVQAHI